MLKNGFLYDGVRWIIGEHPPKAIPLCPQDFIELNNEEFVLKHNELKCEECGKIYVLSRDIWKEKKLILDKINSKIFKKMSFINFDDEAIPVAESKATSKDKKYFVNTRIVESKVGTRSVIYAGERGKNEKTQIFIEPEIRRLAFDQKDLHPTDIFAKLEATFANGTKAVLKKKK